MAPAIPDRWLSYKPVGQRVPGTRFIAFKVPLRKHVVASLSTDLQLSCDSLIEKVPNLGLIVDLTNTERYYDPYFFISKGIEYEKIMIPGREVPPTYLVKKFKRIVLDFLQKNKNNNKLIGVHCTHGVNRTGYLICNFMVSEMKIKPIRAIRNFEKFRGHLIERENYRNNLIKKKSPICIKKKCAVFGSRINEEIRINDHVIEENIQANSIIK